MAHLQCRRRNPAFAENLPQTRDVQVHHLSLGTREPELRQHRARLRAEASHRGALSSWDKATLLGGQQHGDTQFALAIMGTA